MLRSNRKSLGNHVVSPEEEKERLQWEGFVEKEGFKACIIRKIVQNQGKSDKCNLCQKQQIVR